MTNWIYPLKSHNFRKLELTSTKIHIIPLLSPGSSPPFENHNSQEVAAVAARRRLSLMDTSEESDEDVALDWVTGLHQEIPGDFGLGFCDMEKLYGTCMENEINIDK